jgi:1A family penicillin-binding protein
MWVPPRPLFTPTVRRGAAYAALFLFSVMTVLVGAWSIRHMIAIERLKRGVGDTIFHAADGRAWFRLDEQRRDVDLSSISPHLQNAVVAVEDHRFHRHRGVDLIALGRAVLHNLRARRLAEGGSTLTQQLARTLFLSSRRTYGRKVKEALLAVLMERRLSKDQILELYLNRVYLGRGLYGVETMSRRAFGKGAKDLSLAEAALLAGIIRAPERLSPWGHMDDAVKRSRVVLARMREEKYISEDEEKAARAARPRVGAPPRLQTARWGYAKQFLREQFAEEVGGDHPPDWRVDTTLRPEVQDAAEDAVRNGLRRLGIRGLQAALVALRPRTGDVLAIVGGENAAESPYNRAAYSRRQPGSAFKPFVYAAALDRGLSPISRLDHLHEVKVTASEEEWAPRNVNEMPDEETLRDALAHSNNQAAVALQQKIGSRAVLDVARGAGLEELPDVPSLALGSGLVTPLGLTSAFAIFANGGYAVRPRAIVRVLDADGDVVFQDNVASRRVISEEAAFQTLTMLRDVVDFGTGARVRQLGLRLPAAGKTGTTNDFHDAWFVGLTSEVVAGVWVGFDQPAPIGDEAFGARVALPIWTEFMKDTQRLLPAEEFEPPAGLRSLRLCRVSHQRAASECPAYTEYFKDGDAIPRERCQEHRGDPLKQLERTIHDVIDEIGRTLGGIFE